MTYEHLLHDFIDGTLDYQGETSLFAELHANDGLRRDLRLLMLMQKSAAHDVNAYMPPPDSHEAIFRRLGFSTGLTPSATAGYGFGGHMEGLIGAILGALVTVLIFLGVDRFAPRPIAHNAASSPSAAGIAASAPIHHDTLFLRDGGATGSEARSGMAADMNIASTDVPATPRSYRSGATIRREGRKDVGMARRSDNADGSRGMGIPSGTTPPAVIAHGGPATIERTELLGAAAPRRIAEGTEIGPLSRLPRHPFPGSEEEIANDPLPFALEYRATTSRSFTPPPEGLGNPTGGSLHDKELGGFYSLGNGVMIGAEIGEEEFYQRFDETLPTGDILRHEQNPSLIWGGIALRKNFGDAPGFLPFVEGMLGGTGVGPVGRMMAGASYDMTDDIRLVAGAEVGTLAYRFGGSWYLSPKYGVTYGLSLRF